jgi:threonine synthase
MGKETASLVCIDCRREYSSRERIWKCGCGGLLDLQFRPSFPIAKIRSRKPNLWRYREAIPLAEDRHVVSFDEGFTPLLPIEIAGRPVWVKQDHLFPTGSYKDRGAAVLISKARELGVKTVVEDSSGNAGCAIAAYCAKAEIACDVFVPADTSPAKLAQIECYGAVLHRIPGSREATARAVLRAAASRYYASHSWNPFFFQGTKTFAFEICEQLGWKSPDAVIVPVGNGTLLLGAHLGFRELRQAGIVAGAPKIIGVQPARCAPLSRAFHRGLKTVPPIPKQDTLAEGIAIAEPVRGPQILEAVELSRGEFVEVEEEEVKKALIDLARKGFYVEPTAAATIAAIPKYLSHSPEDEVVVSVLTGHGLKSTEKILKLLEEDH